MYAVINKKKFLKTIMIKNIRDIKTMNSFVFDGLNNCFIHNRILLVLIRSGLVNKVIIGMIAPIPRTSRKVPTTFSTEKPISIYLSLILKRKNNF